MFRDPEETPAETDRLSGLTEAAVHRFRHDARNQLNLIVGYLDLLARPSVGQLNPKQQMFIGRIRTASQNVEALVEGLLPPQDAGKRAT